MHWTPQLQAFIAAHSADDTSRLLLSARRYPDIDMAFAVEQIEGRRRLQGKLPEWLSFPDVIVAGQIPTEQCSSEQTARHKRELVIGDTLIDITGGMGVDFWYMSRGLRHAVYVERQTVLCDIASHNFAILSAGATSPAIDVINADGIQFLNSLSKADASLATIYVDPARRATDGSRVYDITQCEPDVVANQDILRAACARLLIKASPMADIARLLTLVHGIEEVHVVGVRGECKEVLLVVGGGSDKPDNDNNPIIRCVDFTPGGELHFAFSRAEESSVDFTLAESVQQYLYEPDVTIMKAGAFRTVAARYGLSKLDVNTHLYTSTKLISGFAGKTFIVDDVAPLSSRLLKKLRHDVPLADISVRNAPLTVAELRRRTGIADGGHTHLFAATVHGLGAQIIRCRRILTLLIAFATIFVHTWANANAQHPSLADILKDIKPLPPSQWEPGYPFVYTDSIIHVDLFPIDTTETSNPSDRNAYGRIWRFSEIVAEENWLGQTSAVLRFITSWGDRYGFDTGRPPHLQSISPECHPSCRQPSAQPDAISTDM